jgi:hypothetical protein
MPPTIEIQVRSLLLRFIQGEITIDQCKQEAGLLVPSIRFLDRLNIILTMSNDPLPPRSPNRKEPARTHRQAWTEEEDNRLLCGVYRYGLQDWGQIATFVGSSRTRAQCAQRWSRGLDPRLSKDGWSPDEDAKLMNLVASFGTDGWTAISQRMGHRSDVQCRYRYQRLKKLKCMH